MTRLDADGCTVADRVSLMPAGESTLVVLRGYTGPMLTLFEGRAQEAAAFKARLVETLESLVESAVAVVRAAS